MPTAKDIEFSKLLIAKGLVSRAEMQRHLDEVEEQRNAGNNISLERILLEAKVITELELRYMQAPKKRVLHCSKCHTMYRAQEEDIGKKFKCKKCGTWVTVPRPGQALARTAKDAGKAEDKAAKSGLDVAQAKPAVPTPARPVPKPTEQALPPSVADIKQQNRSEMDEMTLMVGLDDDTGNDSAAAPVAIEIPTAGKDKPDKTPEPSEVTIMVDLDDNADDQEDAAAVIDEDDDATMVDPHVAPAKPAAVAPAKPEEPKSVSRPPAKQPEITVMVDLDEDEDEKDQAAPLVVPPDLLVAKPAEAKPVVAKPTEAKPVAGVKPEVKPVAAKNETANAAEISKNEAPKVAARPAEAKKIQPPEITVMVDLDEDEEEEVQPIASAKPAEVKPIASAKPSEVKPIASAKPAEVKPIASAKPAEAKPIAAKSTETPKIETGASKPADVKRVPPKPIAESTIMLDLDEDKQEDVAPVKEEELGEWALSGYGGEGSENVEVKMQLDLEQYKVAPEPPPAPYLNANEDVELKKWAGQAAYLDDKEDKDLDAWANGKAPAAKPTVAPAPAAASKPAPVADSKAPESAAIPSPTAAPASPWATTPVAAGNKPAVEPRKLAPLPARPVAKPEEIKPATPALKEIAGEAPAAPEKKKLERVVPKKPPVAESTIMLDLDEDKDEEKGN